MSKYNKNQSISKNSDQDESGDHWLTQFEKNLEKIAVQPRHKDESLFDQINSIMNGSQSKYKTVESKVDDMKERSGLKAYLDKMSSEKNVEKTASAADENDAFVKQVDMTPIVIKKFPSIKNSIENYIRDSKGNLPIPAIIGKIRSIHKKDVSNEKDWEDDNLIRFVSRLNLMAKQNNPVSFQENNNLGGYDYSDSSDEDNSNSDAFKSLQPVKF
jgi:hypothetical protein